MNLKKTCLAASGVTLAILLTSCGSEGNSAGTVTPEAAAANSNTVDSATTRSVSGRVADGYLKGATVCVDLNASNTCDIDEPAAITGDGGVYDLNIPRGAENKAIVASIPAEAIDEDTGQPIGKALVFSAPAGKPEFISPITTLVHHELISNPTLSVDDAETAVKFELGVSDEDVSLFDDFVAGSKGIQTERQSDFRHLHDTARVITSMMKDIELQVGQAAVSKGIDVAGNPDTQQAIRELVRSQVREMLPEIARQVTQIARIETDSTLESAGTNTLNPDAIAITLRPVNLTDHIEQRIDAAREQTVVAQLDLKTILTEGLFAIDIDCWEDHDNSEKTCNAFYTDISLTASSDELITDQFEFDLDSGTWAMELDEGNQYGSDFNLIDGVWTSSQSTDASADPIRFNADGSAVVTTDESEMRISAVTRDLSATAVQRHLFASDAAPVWFDLVNGYDLFAAGAQAHVISLKSSFNPYVLYNYTDRQDGQSDDTCAPYLGNCNVILDQSNSTSNSGGDAGTPIPFNTLADIQQASLVSAKLKPLWGEFGSSLYISLSGNPTDAAGLPETGLVTWHDSYSDGSYYYDDSASANEPREFERCYSALEPLYQQGPTDQDQSVWEEYYATVISPEEQKCDKLFSEYFGSEENTGTDSGATDTDNTGQPTYSHTDAVEACYDENNIVFEQGPASDSEADYDAFQLQLERQNQSCFELEQSLTVDPSAQNAEGSVAPTEQDTFLFESMDEYAACLVDVDTLSSNSPEGGSDEQRSAHLAAVEDQISICKTILEHVRAFESAENNRENKETDVDRNLGFYPASNQQTTTSRWEIVTVDGVTMIQIQLPEIFRFEGNGERALLLVEKDGYVRLGAKVQENVIDQAIVYNESAFNTLLALIQRGYGNHYKNQ